ncbi:MAG: type II toxin-antitoxin system RelE/ParE family toxin [Bacilli bacterium]|nr:type II toxin-antitoxin system RelE/ParE family toxin [Bacilli bacterium]
MTSDYKVVLSPSCTDDIESIFEYIAFCLLEPKLAKDIIEEIKNRLVSLSYMPYRFRQFKDDSSIRVITIKSYIAIYKIDEHTRTVMILRMFHSTQNVEDKYLIEVN